MNMTAIRPDEVQALIDTFDASAWEEMRISTEDFEIRLAKDPSLRDRGRQTQQVTPGASPPSNVRLEAPSGDVGHRMESSASRAAKGPGHALSNEPPAGHVYLRAANLGTFYKAPKPGANPYVEVGQAVEIDTEVCVIEVMKLFTPMYAGVRGVVREILVQDTELVEFEQPLFVIEVTA